MKIHDLDGHAAVIAEVAQKAVNGGQVVTLSYKGEVRNVEVHAIGVSKAFNPVMRAFDIEKKSWRLFSLDKVETITLSGDTSMAPRTLEGYVRGDKGMVDILVEA